MRDRSHFATSIEHSDGEYRSATIQRRTRAFWFGLAATTLGTALHFPMFWESRHMGYHMADMPMDAGMIVGMVLIVVGLAVTTYGLIPVGAHRDRVANLRVRALDDAPI
ncbi:hypothetical protein, partial [Nocardia sp. NPDC060255]